MFPIDHIIYFFDINQVVKRLSQNYHFGSNLVTLDALFDNSKNVYFNNPNLSLVFNGIFLLLYKISFNSSNIPSLILSS